LDIFKKTIYRKLDEGIVDGWQLGVNTVKPSDLAYMASMEAENPKVKQHFIASLVPSYNNCDTLRSYEFFRYCQDDDTIYIRFDDDIVWIEEGVIEKMVQARIDHPDAFVIYPNVINSTLLSAWHQQIGAIGTEAGVLRRHEESPDPNHVYLHAFAYTDAGLISLIHETFKRRYNEGTLSAYYLPSRPLVHYERFSICSVAFWGKDHFVVDPNEEQWIAWQRPAELGRPVYFLGDALMVHFAYHTQRESLPDINQRYLEFFREITK
jgi:hypothetical protein